MKTHGHLITGILALTLAGGSLAASQTVTRQSQPQQKSPVGVVVDTAAHAAAVYRCPMDPEVVSDKPGTCPKCGMKLKKMESDSARGMTMKTGSSPAAESSREKCAGAAKTVGKHHGGMSGGSRPHNCCNGKDGASCTGKGEASCTGKGESSCNDASSSAGARSDSVFTQ